MPYKIPSSCSFIIRLAICYSTQGHTFLLELSVDVHTGRETFVIGVNTEWASNDHGVLGGGGLSVRWTPTNKF